METPEKAASSAPPAQPLGSSRRPPQRTSHASACGPSAPLERLRSRDGKDLILRELQPDDVAAMQRGFAHLNAEEVRFRFLHPMTELPHESAVRLCNLDPQTAPALVLVDPPGTAEPEIHAIARAYIDPATLCAEFAIVVQGRHAGQGFGRLLLTRLIELCRSRGVAELWGDVLMSNSPMLGLCERLGFRRQSQAHEPGVLRVTLDLNPAAAG